MEVDPPFKYQLMVAGATYRLSLASKWDIDFFSNSPHWR
jgi:hypothetical protein